MRTIYIETEFTEMKKINLTELRRLVEQVLNEDAYDDISFDFMDREDERKSQIKRDASEAFYNKLAKDEAILKEMFIIIKQSRNKESAKSKIRDSQVFNRIEQIMEEIYKFPELKSVTGQGEIFDLLKATYDKFFEDVYGKSMERINRAE